MTNQLRRLTLLIGVIMLAVTACAAPATPPPPPAPTAAPIPGFHLITGNGISLQLPESYDGGKANSEDFKLVLDRIKSLGSEFENIAKAVESNPDLYLLWAFDSQVGPSGFLTNANITSEQVISAVSVQAYVEAVRKQLPAQIKVLSQDDLTVAGQPAIRLVSTMEQFNAKQAMYLVKQGNRIYVVTYSTGIDEFDQRLKQFEQSVQTFTVTP